MDGKDLLRALMREAQLNPNALADLLRKRSLQSQITRFLDGSTRNPRWETLKPVAEYFKIGVEAFFDPKVAEAAAVERGLISRAPGLVGASAAPANDSQLGSPFKPQQPKLGLGELLLQLASALKPYDLSARKAAASLLADLVLDPDTADITAERIERLLNDPGNGVPRRSTHSPG